MVRLVGAVEFGEPLLVPREPAGLELVDHIVEPGQLRGEDGFAVFLFEQEQSW